MAVPRRRNGPSAGEAAYAASFFDQARRQRNQVAERGRTIASHGNRRREDGSAPSAQHLVKKLRVLRTLKLCLTKELHCEENVSSGRTLGDRQLAAVEEWADSVDVDKLLAALEEAMPAIDVSQRARGAAFADNRPRREGGFSLSESNPIRAPTLAHEMHIKRGCPFAPQERAQHPHE